MPSKQRDAGNSRIWGPSEHTSAGDSKVFVLSEHSESGCRKRKSAKGVRSLFFVFGTLSVAFWSLFLMLLSLFSSLFCQTPFAGLLLRQGEAWLCFFCRRPACTTILVMEWLADGQTLRQDTASTAAASTSATVTNHYCCRHASLPLPSHTYSNFSGSEFGRGFIVCTARGSCNDTLLRRKDSYKVFKTALMRFLRRCLGVGFGGRKGSEKAS